MAHVDSSASPCCFRWHVLYCSCHQVISNVIAHPECTCPIFLWSLLVPQDGTDKVERDAPVDFRDAIHALAPRRRELLSDPPARAEVMELIGDVLPTVVASQVSNCFASCNTFCLQKLTPLVYDFALLCDCVGYPASCGVVYEADCVHVSFDTRGRKLLHIAVDALSRYGRSFCCLVLERCFLCIHAHAAVACDSVVRS